MNTLTAVLVGALAAVPAILAVGILVAWAALRRDSRQDRQIEEELRRANRELEARKQLLSEVSDELAQMVLDRDRKARRFEAARNRAEEASKAKGRFLASMSHELRTPLNSVIGFSNHLLKTGEGRFEERDLTFLRKISENGVHLLEIIDRILELAGVDGQERNARRISTDLVAIVREVVDAARPNGAENGEGRVELRTELPDSGAHVLSDPEMLKQALGHLVDNALKFTEQGSVTVAVRVDRAGRPRCIEVVDEGVGIDEESLPHIFEAFEQADGSYSRPYEGLGLGLALARALCDVTDCGLEVESVVGEGSTFRITLPEERDDGRWDEEVPTIPRHGEEAGLLEA